MVNSENTLFKYNGSIIWSLPCMFQYEVILGAFQSTLNELGMQPLTINAFGSPLTIWSGGRAPIVKENLDKNKLLKLFNYVSSIHNATPTLTFSRTDIKKEDLNDKYANFLLDFAIEHGARFIVSSDILRDYIKSKNANTIVVASILKSISRFQGKNKIEKPTVENETNYYNKLLKEYDIIVVRPEYSKLVLINEPNLLDDISRIEVLINQLCYNNCPNAPLHNTRETSKHLCTEFSEHKFFCYKNKLSIKQQYFENSAHTQLEVQKLINSGVKHLKLQGRGEYVPYIINAINLATQIFNFDGANSILLNSLLRDRLIIEYSKFHSFVDLTNSWHFDNDTVGLKY